jgi:hypothetical protein
MLNITNPYAGLLSSEEEKKLGQQAQTMGLLNLASALFAAGGPSPVRQGLGGAFAQGLPAYMQGVQGTYEQGVNTMLTREKIQEMQRKRTEEEAIRRFIPQIYQTPTPETREAVATEQGPDYVVRPATAGGINYDALRQLMLVSPERGTKIAEGLKSLQPKTSVQSIFNEKGQEVKVRYNEDTGQYSPIGGAKAEPFIQIDRGNVIELRRPSGDIVGTVPKGAAPVAPSFSMTESGQVLNTKTGQLLQPRDEQGNIITIDTSVKATEDEKKSAGFFLRMRDATSTFNSPVLDSQGKPVLRDGKPVLLKDAAEKPEIVAEVIGSLIPRWMGGQAAQNFATSSIRQQYQQAQENWVTANLRPESGAVIGPEEMQKEIRKYFPQVGDSNDTIRQKEKSREVTEEAIRRRAGRAIGAQQSQQRNVSVDY